MEKKKKLLFLSLALLIALTFGCLDNPPYVVYGDVNNNGINDLIVLEDTTDDDRVSVSLDGTNEEFVGVVFSQAGIIENSLFLAYGNGDGTFQKAREISKKDLLSLKNS